MLAFGRTLIYVVEIEIEIEIGLATDGREFDFRPPQPVLGWVTVFGRVNHVGTPRSHLRQLSLLPYAGRLMSAVQSAVTLCGWGVKAGTAVDKRLGGR